MGLVASCHPVICWPPPCEPIDATRCPSCPDPTPVEIAVEVNVEPTPVASMPRRPYAVAPLAAMPPASEPATPSPPPPVRPAASFHVTNLGTLLDVLA